MKAVNRRGRDQQHMQWQDSTYVIAQQIRTIVANLLCLDECSISHTAHIREELGADSLDTIEIINALVNTFDIEIRDEDGLCISTIDDIAVYIAVSLQGREAR